MCAIYTPETYVHDDPESGHSLIKNIAAIHKDRLALKCSFCKLAHRGTCFQCSAEKCTKAYHATCAAAAGVLVVVRDVFPNDPETGLPVSTPVTEIDYRCVKHRTKRGLHETEQSLEADTTIKQYCQKLKRGDIIQAQFLKPSIFAGVVLENRASELMLLIDLLPKG